MASYRTKNRKLQVHEARRVEIDYVSVDDAITTLRDAAVGLEDPQIDIQQEYEYGESYTRMYVEGWRDATAQDKANKAAEDKARKETAEQHAEWLVEQLRRVRPEALK